MMMMIGYDSLYALLPDCRMAGSAYSAPLRALREKLNADFDDWV
jgi:hypothetical protein